MGGKTLVHKILERTSGGADTTLGQILTLTPDKIVLYDWPAVSDWLMDVLEKDLGMAAVPDPERVVVFLDHLVPVSNPLHEKFHAGTRAWCRRNGVQYIEGLGIGHLVVLEEGIIKPGMLVTHFDTHISTVGAIGALGIGVAKEVVMPLATGKMWLKMPQVVKIELTGALRKGVSGRDLLNQIVKDHGPDWALGRVVAFGGEGASSITMESRTVICDLANYFSAITAVFEPDEVSEDYMRELGIGDYEFVRSDDDADFDGVTHYDLDDIDILVGVPPNTASIETLSSVEGTPVDLGIIGTCASGKLEDIRWAAEVLKGRRVHRDFKLFVVPTTNRIYAEAARRGYLAALADAGAFISSPTCDYCYGKAVTLSPGQKAISTLTLNVPGRLGCVEADIYLANAAVVAASAMTGQIADPTSFLEEGVAK